MHVVFHINDTHIMPQLAFCPSTVFFVILPITVYLVRSFELLCRVLSCKCTTFYNVAILLLKTCCLPIFLCDKQCCLDVNS